MTNPIFDYANASSYRRSSEIDQWDIAVIRDMNYTGTIKTKPKHLHFKSSDVQNLYFWQDARLVLKFDVIIPPFGQGQTLLRGTTIKSDVRSFIDRASLDLNGVNVGDHNSVDIWAILDRACYSEDYYKNVASEWLCHDVPPDASGLNAMGRYTRGATGVSYAIDGPMPWAMFEATAAPAAETVMGELHNCGDNGFARRYQLTRVTNHTGATEAQGRTITATIPLKHVYSFLRYLNVALKNVQFDFKLDLHNPAEPGHFCEYDELFHQTKDDVFKSQHHGVMFRDAYIEVPRVTPSPAALISINNTYLNNPNLLITYPSYKVYKNTITQGAGVKQELMINNETDRLLRYTAIMIPTEWDTTCAVDARRSIHNALNNFVLMVNGTRVPQSDLSCSFSEGTPDPLTVRAGGSAVLCGTADNTANPAGGSATGALDVHTLYRNYLEMCSNYYTNNCNATDGMYVMPYRGSGRLSYREFAFLNPMVTVDLSRSAQNAEFIGGMSQITAQLTFDYAPTSTNCWLYSIVESEQRVSISLSERAAFVETKLGPRDALPPPPP